MNNSPSNIFKILLLLERYRQNSQAVLAATGMNGLNILSTYLSYPSNSEAVYFVLGTRMQIFLKNI